MDRPALALLRDYDGPVPGAALLVVRDGRDLVRRGLGLADLDACEPVTPATNFRLASLTKQFTAAAVLLLAEDGRLRLDDPARRWLPSLASAVQRSEASSAVKTATAIGRPQTTRSWRASITAEPRRPLSTTSGVVVSPGPRSSAKASSRSGRQLRSGGRAGGTMAP